MSSPSRLDVVATGLTKEFGGGVVALRNVDLHVANGGFVSIVGPSGCGKSTLLRLVAGLVDRTLGSLEVGGSPVVGPRDDVGIMFQRPVLLQWKTALENAVLPRRLRGEERAARDEALDLLSKLGLAGFEHTYPAHLSGGMQQRVALARLLMTGAQLLLLDEPFGALDEFTRERLNLELLSIHQEFDVTIVFVTHNIQEAVFLADSVVVMTPHPGEVAATFDVELPRPREIEMMRTAAFTDLVFKVRSVLEPSTAGDYSRTNR